jgi:hypothetical protein
MDLTEMHREAGLSDLSWLELHDQDPDRLPENPVNLGIPELEEAWGVERRTDGIHFYDNVDLDTARYQASLQKTERTWKHSAAELARVVRKAMRRSAAGYGLKELMREAAEALGDEAHRIRTAMKLVQAEHGLVGNVYIRAAAYPGYEQGKWAKHLKKVASNARYIVVDATTLKGASHIQSGRCTVTRKQAVTQVPWGEAVPHYRPRLEAAGRKVAGDGPTALRAAFLSYPSRMVGPADVRPHHTAEADRISDDAARQAFAEAAPEERKVYDTSEKRAAQERLTAQRKVVAWTKAGLLTRDQAKTIVTKDLGGRAMLRVAAALVLQAKGAAAFSGLPIDVRPPEVTLKEARSALAEVKAPEPIDISHRHRDAARRDAHQKVARWHRRGFLAEKQARRLLASKADPEQVLRAAATLIMQAREAADYSGVANDPRAKAASDADVWKALAQAEKRAQQAQEHVDTVAKARRTQSTREAREAQKTVARVGKVRLAIDKGVRGQALQKLILRTLHPGDVRVASQVLDPILRETGALQDSQTPSRTYEGAEFHTVPQRVASVKPGAKDIGRLLRWAAQMMNEGSAGSDLDSMLQARWSAVVRKQAAKELAALREQHEGGAGFIYVDASAYASSAGTTGCDKGGLKARANQVRYVLAMDRCASCAARSIREDGSARCQKYSKTLITADDLPDEMPLLKQANIKTMGMTDDQVTASMFSPQYDPHEYGLQNSCLDGIEMDEDIEPEALGEILFGGMEWV